MPTNENLNIPFHPGLMGGSNQVASRLRIGPEDGAYDAYFAALEQARITNKFPCAIIHPSRYMHGISGSTSATVGMWQADYDTGGTASWSGNDGWRLNTGTSSGNKITVRHLSRWVPANDKWVTFQIRARVQATANTGFAFGIMASNTDPFTSNPSNGVWLHKTNASADVVGRAQGGGSGASDTATPLATLVDASGARTGFVTLGFAFKKATAAADCQGFFHVNRTTVVPFTSAQLTEVSQLTGDMFFMFCAQTGTGAARYAEILSAIGECDE
ncbi:MAG TPA: hypothetical protein PKA27_02280 [Fimbriimonadaceae bacterium]|nr:hypothetical protein [Fimbriimonadaceae bacterium]